jgi:hypothetical protein
LNRPLDDRDYVLHRRGVVDRITPNGPYYYALAQVWFGIISEISHQPNTDHLTPSMICMNRQEDHHNCHQLKVPYELNDTVVIL